MRHAYANAKGNEHADSDEHANAKSDEHADSDEHANAKSNEHADSDEQAKARGNEHADSDEHTNADERARARVNEHANADERAKANNTSAAEHAQAGISALGHTLHRDACRYAGAVVRIGRWASVLFHRAKRCSTRAVSAFSQRAG